MKSSSKGRPPDAAYWDALAAGKLMLQCCENCKHWHWPAVSRCGECGNWNPSWCDVELRAVVYSWTKVWYRFAGTEAIELPYITVLAALPQAGSRRLLGLFDGDESLLNFDLPLLGRVSRTQFAGEQVPAIRWRVAT